MSERPILFSGEMVRAILDDRKTQARRVCKDQTVGSYSWVEGIETLPKSINPYTGWAKDCGLSLLLPTKCPYGKPGDTLWVRETWTPSFQGNDCIYRADNSPEPFAFKGPWTPSIHMPRWASRINLLVKDVRVQRLQDISDSDVRSEGVPEAAIDKWRKWLHPNDCPGSAFGELWDSINGKKHPWSANPWVWAITFEVQK